MSRKIKNILSILMALIFAVSTFMLVFRSIKARQAEKQYNEAKEIVNHIPESETEPVPETASEPEVEPEPESEPKPESKPNSGADTNADDLKEKSLRDLINENADIIGWISIPGTALDYPLLHGTDNAYYLNHTWKKTYNPAGSILLECSNSTDLSDFSTIIYGHRMKNSSMFGTLKRYKDVNYFTAHPYVYIENETAVYRYAIYAAYEADVESVTYYLSFPTDAAKQAFIDYGLVNSVIDSGIVPDINGMFLTLSTCTGNGYETRFVVQAVLSEVSPVT